MLKEGDTVKLRYDPGDLRQPVKVGDVGLVTGGPYDDNAGGEWYWVTFVSQDTAMRMWEKELEVIGDT
jgi:hypothetical protein